MESSMPSANPRAKGTQRQYSSYSGQYLSQSPSQLQAERTTAQPRWSDAESSEVDRSSTPSTPKRFSQANRYSVAHHSSEAVQATQTNGHGYGGIRTSETKAAIAMTSHSSRKLSANHRWQKAQENLYDFLLKSVKTQPPEVVLTAFKNIFIQPTGTVYPGLYEAMVELLVNGQEQEFQHTLKRCCYILVNNWDTSRHYQAIHDLVDLFNGLDQHQRFLLPRMTQLRSWLRHFMASRDFQELQFYATRYDDFGHWKQRFLSFLLTAQYANDRNPREQREAARTVARKVRERFKRDLAMYVARSQTNLPTAKPITNPTGLGDDLLRLVKMVIVRRGTYSYENLAHHFLQELSCASYGEFKQRLPEYLAFGVGSRGADVLKQRLAQRLCDLETEAVEDDLNGRLIHTTCLKLIDCLTTETEHQPSALMVAFLAQGDPLTLAVFLLKIILLCPASRIHLEVRMAQLIHHYEAMPVAECQWVVQFLEILNLALTIHAEDIEYSLIRMHPVATDQPPVRSPAPSSVPSPAQKLDQPASQSPESYRIFSQIKHAGS